MTHEERRKQLLKVALTVATLDGLDSLNRPTLAREAGVSESLVQFHFHNMSALREAVLLLAVEKRVLPILCDNISKITGRLPEDLRQDVLNYVGRQLC